MTSESNRTGGMHSQDAVPNDSLNDPYSRDNPLVEPVVAGTPPNPSGSGSGGDKKDAAKHEAQQVGKEGAEAGKKVAGTAKDEAGHVMGEAKSKASGLVSELGDDVRSQAKSQQQRAAEGLRSVSKELGSMADKSGEQGTATNLVRQAASRTEAAAGWLGDRDPSSLLDEVKSFARKRPGAFLAIAAGAGLLAGRFARGAKADTDSMNQEHSGHQAGTRTGSPNSYGTGYTGTDAPRDMNPPAAPPVPPTGTTAPPVPAPGTTTPAVGEPGRRDYP